MISKFNYFFRLRNFRREKGAALVMVILLLLLLMSACAAILLIAGLANTSTVDAVNEKQALHAAEAGMQMTLNVLRGNATGTAISFKEAATRIRSNKGDDWMPIPRLSNWLNYNYPTTLPDRVTLTPGYTPYNGLAFSVTVEAPDATVVVVPTPNPTWTDGPVVKPIPPVKPPQPAWHPWHCSHCSWDYTHCSLYNPPNNGTLRSDGTGCRHKHCIPPTNWGNVSGDDGYQRLLVKVTGYGPRGARKEIELLLKRTIFDLEGEPLVFIKGSTNGTSASLNVSGTPEVKFDSGDNIAFFMTNSGDETAYSNVVNITTDKITTAGKGDDFEVLDPVNRPADLPKWLSSIDAVKTVQSDLEEDAKSRNRWFTSFPTANAGTDTLPQVTFVRGDAILNNGTGLLIVTGKLTIDRNFTYKGLVLLLGDATVEIIGGDAKIEGAIILAKFGTGNDFLSPTMNLSGVGKMEFKYGSDKVDVAESLVNMRVLAVRQP